MFGEGGTKTWAGGRDQTNSECDRNLMNILLQILCYSSLVWVLPSNLEVKTKKIKKDLHRKILGFLITFTSSVLLFHGKKRLWLPVFGQKFASCASTKVYSRLRSSSSNLEDTAQNAIPRA